MLFSLPITPFGLFTALGFVFASFLFWRNLRGDYLEEEILSLTVYLSLGGLLVSRVVYVVAQHQLFWQNPAALILWTKYPGFSLTGAALGMGAILIVWGKRQKLDIWPVLDQMVVVSLFLFIFGSLGAWIKSQTFFYLLKALVGLFVLFLAKKFFKKYRSFILYPSGKVGFVGLASNIVFFSLILPLDFFSKGVLLFEGIGFLVIILGSLGLLYLRSERRPKEDLKYLISKYLIFSHA